MTGRRRMLAAALAAAAVSAFSWSAGAAAAEGATVFKGAFQCDDGKPLAGARVELWEWSHTWLPKVWPNATMRIATQADANGAWGFRVSGDETNWFARVVLSSAETEVREWLFPWNWFADTAPNQNDVPVQDYGTQRVPGYQCKTWNGFREAVLDYQRETGSPAPQGEVVVRAGAPNAGKPFAYWNEVIWPSGYPVFKGGASVPKHEFAHTFRHFFDGDKAHFLVDVARFWYLRHHDARSCEPTNSGFAFNEGWAEYWAGKVYEPCANRNDYRIERNVAAGLERLQILCGITRGRMAQALRDNPWRIHSFREFQNALGCRPSTPVGRDRAAERITRAEKRLLLAQAARESLRSGRRWVAGIDGLFDRVRVDLRSAKRLADRLVPCPVRPCAEQAERTLRPILLAGQLTQARAVRSAFALYSDRSALRRLVRAPLATQIRRFDRRGDAVMRRLAGISSRTLARAGRALARLGGGELTSAGRDALAQARAAAGRGEAGVLQGLVPVAVTRLRPVGPTPVDAPIVDTAEQGEPAPAPSLRAASTLEIALSPCDGTGLWTPFGDPYLARVRGRLLPERQGSLVRVTHRRFSGSTPIDPLVHTVQTDAEGWWEDTVTPDDWSAGYGPRWEIQASFQGDAERLPGESTICAVRAHYP